MAPSVLGAPTLKRVALRRRTPLRRVSLTRRKQTVHPLRRGAPPPLPKDWRARCERVAWRDHGDCRYCGAPAPDGQVDHIIPRVIADAEYRDALDNLVWLCPRHHGHKGAAERALFNGRQWPWSRFLFILELTGPIPTPAWRAAALGRVRERLDA